MKSQKNTGVLIDDARRQILQDLEAEGLVERRKFDKCSAAWRPIRRCY